MTDDTIHEGSGCVFCDLGVPCPPVKTPAEEAALKALLAWARVPSSQPDRLQDAEDALFVAIAAVKQERGA